MNELQIAEKKQDVDLNWLNPEPKIPAVMTHPATSSVRRRAWPAGMISRSVLLVLSSLPCCKLLSKHSSKHNHTEGDDRAAISKVLE